jgi:hypothetical protein
MSRESGNEVSKVNGMLLNGYDYENQAWVVNGIYVDCGHPSDMACGCYGREHKGEFTKDKWGR